MVFSIEIKIDQKRRGRDIFSESRQIHKYMSLRRRLRAIKLFKEVQERENSRTVTLEQNTEDYESRKKRNIEKGQYICGKGSR